MKNSALIIALTLLTCPASALAERYDIDGRHTFPVFEVDHYGFSIQRGRFNKVSGSLDFDPERQAGSVDVIIDAHSVDMGSEDWNKHMRGERFFNTAQYPTLRFTARDFRLDADKPSRIAGSLTLLGVTRPLTLAVTRWRCAKHPVLPRQLCGANLETTIRRSDFGMNYGVPGIGDEVRILIPIEAIKES